MTTMPKQQNKETEQFAAGATGRKHFNFMALFLAFAGRCQR